jgi:hypothetical protein
MRHTFDWRASLAQLALVTLALSAAYGVYRFQAHFTPSWVALVSATSFELTYIGLAVLQTTQATRKRATAISVGAVVVSVVYNSLSALFDIRPALLVSPPLWAHATLAVLHGVPLAFVAFLVSDLLLHSAPVVVQSPIFTAARIASDEMVSSGAMQVQLRTTKAAPSRAYECPNCGSELTLGAYGAAKRHGHCKACKIA